mmetsp:Transcript_10856/g.32651  ORF Transcript_10856/g.32651 Transcript_10856/m.32651 type:complete len:187 (+) Transcript_10856:1-561(+)
MLARRPRPRVGGFYALRESKWKTVKQQDMFLPADLKGTFHVETVWWRFFRFFDDGSVRYALVNEHEEKKPLDLALSLLRADQPPSQRDSASVGAGSSSHTTNKKKGPTSYIGDFALRPRFNLDVDVRLPHAKNRFEFHIQHSDRGHFLRLKLLHFLQFIENSMFDPIEHDLPKPPHFSFVPVPNWA